MAQSFLSLVIGVLFPLTCFCSPQGTFEGRPGVDQMITRFRALDPHSSLQRFRNDQKALAYEITEALCPPSTYEAFTSFRQLDHGHPECISVSQGLVIKLKTFLSIYKTQPQNETVDHRVGRLLIVGFHRKEEGLSYLTAGDAEGLRTLFFAFRDLGVPYEIQTYLSRISWRPELTSDRLLASALKPFMKMETQEGRALYESCPVALQEFMVKNVLTKGEAFQESTPKKKKRASSEPTLQKER